MKPPLQHRDNLPWFRQFWPWFLILLPGAVVVASFVTLYIASRHADDLVVDDYYKNGLAINRQLEKIRRAEQLGISAVPEFAALAASVKVTGPVHADKLRLLVSHPLEADRDFAVDLLRVGPGLYRGALRQPVGPRWHWTLLQGPESDWRVDGVVGTGDGQLDAGE